MTRVGAGAAVLAATAAVLAAAFPARAADHLLITEVAVIPTDGEFMEIHNPTSVAVDLSDYYLTDVVFSGDPTQNYWRLTDAAFVPDPAFPTDFVARFPAGATIGPGETLVVSMADDAAFSSFWLPYAGAVVPDFELHADADPIPEMVDPGPAIVGVEMIASQALLSNNREVVVLFRWDGASDLVEDVDIVQWSDAGPSFATVSPAKTGVSVDGPDADVVASTYQADTPPAAQDLAGVTAHPIGRTFRRVDLEEGTETSSGGNGRTGHDETSENLSVTWDASSLPTIGSVEAPTSVAPVSWGRVKARHRTSRGD